MSANLYDSYIGTPYTSGYIPVPFAQYAKVGEAQQGEYNKLRDAMQQQQDAIADIQVRPIDIASKNAYFNEVSQKANEMLTKNKYYTPDMYSEVRSFIRKAARDPRLANWQYALKGYQDERDIEKNLRAQGVPSLRRHDYFSAKPVYDESGQRVWNPQDTQLGVEKQHDWYTEALPYTKDIQPQLTKLKSSVSNMQIRQKDGTVIELPTMNTSILKELNAKEPRVLSKLSERATEWMNSPAGQQWAFVHKVDPSSAEGKKSAIAHLASTISNQRDVTSEEVPLVGLARTIAGGTKREENKGMPLLNAITGSGYSATPGQAMATMNNESPIGNISLDPSEEKRASQRAESRKQEYIKKINSPAYVSSLGWQGLFDSTQTPDEIYNQYLEEERNGIKQFKKESMLKKDSTKAFTPLAWSADPKIGEALSGKFSSINPAQAFFSSATGDGVGESVQNILGKDDMLGMEDIKHNSEFVGFKTYKTPGGYSRIGAEWTIYLPEDKINKVKKNVSKDYYSKHVTQDKKTGLYAVNIVAPALPMYDVNSESSLQKQYGVVDDKDPNFYAKTEQMANLIKGASNEATISNVWSAAKNNKIYSSDANGKQLGVVKVNESSGNLQIPTKDGIIELDPEQAIIQDRLGQINLHTK